MVPDFIRAERAIEQERSSRHQRAQHVVALEEDPLVAGDEVGFRNQVGGVNGLRSEAQVRHRHRARLLRVVDKIALRVIVGVLADNLDGILVGAHGSIRAQAVEHGAHHVVRFGRKVGIVVETRMVQVIVNADREVLLGLGLGKVVEDRFHHRGCEFLRGQAISPANHRGCNPHAAVSVPQSFLHGRDNVEV